MSYYVCIYVIYCSCHTSSLYFFPLLPIVVFKEQTQKTLRGRGKIKNFNASKFLTMNNCPEQAK